MLRYRKSIVCFLIAIAAAALVAYDLVPKRFAEREGRRIRNTTSGYVSSHAAGEAIDFGIHYRRDVPKWLWKLLPRRHIPYIDHIAGVNYSGPLANDRSVSISVNCRRMTHLWLAGANVTDAGVRDLEFHPSLKELSLRDTKITDRSIDSLVTLPSLEVLSLHGTNVTDAEIHKLAKLKSLRKLNLAKTKVSETAQAELRRKLSACYIGTF